MGLDTNIEAKEVESKTRHQGATHTNYKVLWVLLGLVAALTVGFCYLFNLTFRFMENHRKTGERLKDSVGARLYEQQQQRQRDTHH